MNLERLEHTAHAVRGAIGNLWDLIMPPGTPDPAPSPFTSSPRDIAPWEPARYTSELEQLESCLAFHNWQSAGHHEAVMHALSQVIGGLMDVVSRLEEVESVLWDWQDRP